MSDNSAVLERFEKIRKRRIAKANKPESLFTKSPLANALVIIFCLSDFITLYTLWNILLIESPLMLFFIVIAFVIGLDVTMSIAGNVIKQCRQGLRPLKDSVMIVTCCVLAFLGVYVCYFILRLSMTGLTFGAVDAASSLIDMTPAAGTADASDSTIPIMAAAASYSLAFLPFVTSAASLAVSAAVSDPLGEKLAELRKLRAEIESHIALVNCELTESEDTETHIQRLYEREYRLFNTFNDHIDSTAYSLKLKVRNIIMKKLGRSDADIITDMTEDCRRLSESRSGHTQRDNGDDNTAANKADTDDNVPAVFDRDISFGTELTA